MTTLNITSVNPAGARQHFSPARFRATFSLYMGENRRQLLMTLGTTFAVMMAGLLITLLNYRMAYDLPGGIEDPLWQREKTWFFFVAFIYMILAGSMMFSGLSTKERRLAVISTPATCSEKFWTRFLIYVPIALAAFFVCCFVADAIRVVIVKLFFAPQGYARLIPPSYLLSFGDYNPHAAVDAFNVCDSLAQDYILIFMMQAIFALGSSVFVKNSFVKTALAQAAIGTVLSLIMAASTMMFAGNSSEIVFDNLLDSDNRTVLLLTCATFTMAITLIYMLAYARFKETEIHDHW